jgi:hypothetical protein
VVCVNEGGVLLLLCPPRTVPAIPPYGNLSHHDQEDKNNPPAKDQEVRLNLPLAGVPR